MDTAAMQAIAASCHARNCTVTLRNIITSRCESDIVDVALWAGATVPIGFLCLYQKYCKWWRNPAGRAIVALDVCLLMVFIPAVATLAHPTWVYGIWHTWLTITALCLVPVVVTYRGFSIIKHEMASRRKELPRGLKLPNPIEVDSNLRFVLRTGRHYSKLTQREAAEKAGISEIWWSQLETGVKTTTTMDTLLDMLQAVKTPARALIKAGHPEVAHALDVRYDWFGASAME